MHTLYRVTCSLMSAVQVVALFGFFSFILALATGSVEPFVLMVWALVFFAPAAWLNTWEDIGD